MARVTPEEDIVRGRDGFHDPARCPCVRCRGFQPGHQLSAGENYKGGPAPRHGMQISPLKLQPKAAEIAEVVRPLMPIGGEAFEGTLQAYCILLARLQMAHDYLEKVEREKEEGTFDPEAYGNKQIDLLEAKVLSWTKATLRHEESLGLTPRSAAAILRDVKGGDRDVFRPPSQRELEGVSREKLVQLRDAFTAALQPDDFIDAEAM